MAEAQAYYGGNQYQGNPQGSESMRLRLSFEDDIENFRHFLTGVEPYAERNSDGDVTIKYRRVGTMLANDEGVRNIMWWLKSALSTHVVQGNTDDAKLNSWLADFREDMSFDIIINRHTWAIQPKAISGIMGKAMATIRMVASRTLDNEERKSYVPTMKHVESSHQVITDNQKKSGIPYFGGGGQ